MQIKNVFNRLEWLHSNGTASTCYTAVNLSSRLISDSRPHFTVSSFPPLEGWDDLVRSQAPERCSGFKSMAQAMDSCLSFFPPSPAWFFQYFFLPFFLLCNICLRLSALFLLLSLHSSFHTCLISRCALLAHGNLMPSHDPVSQQASNQHTAGSSESRTNPFSHLSFNLFPLPSIHLHH